MNFDKDSLELQNEIRSSDIFDELLSSKSEEEIRLAYQTYRRELSPYYQDKLDEAMEATHESLIELISSIESVLGSA